MDSQFSSKQVPVVTMMRPGSGGGVGVGGGGGGHGSMVGGIDDPHEA